MVRSSAAGSTEGDVTGDILALPNVATFLLCVDTFVKKILTNLVAFSFQLC